MPASTLRIRSLAYGFVGTVLLSVLTVGVAEYEISRVERTTRELAGDAQAATYYLGDLGEQLARLHAHVALGVTQSPEQFAAHETERASIYMELGSSLDALAGLGSGPDALWGALRPMVDRQRAMLADAASAIRAGEPTRAADMLAASAGETLVVHDTLDKMAQRHRAAVIAALRAAHERVGRVRLLEVILDAVFIAGTLVIWMVVIARLRRQSRELSEHTARLESANSDLEAFAGRVAHDLRNALAPIVAGAGLLRQTPNVPERMVDRMERSSQRAVALIDALLAFSKSAQVPSAGESQALPAAVAGVIEELAPVIARHDPEAAVEVEVEELPDLRVACSPGLLHIVLANLCGNAVKFTEGMPVRRVHIAAQREGTACRIDITDTGPGIPKDAQARIFEPFFRVAGSRAPGTGIGLATVRRIVEARRGSISVESAPGAGATFTVRLPLAAMAATRRETPPQTPPRAGHRA